MNEWQMLFNTEKCKVMHLGYNNLKADYVMDGSILYVCSKVVNRRRLITLTRDRQYMALLRIKPHLPSFCPFK